MAQSSTARQIGPSLSIVQLSAIAPVRGTRPNVGLSPVVPQRVEGDEMDPSVSEPMAKATHPAAVAEADPADDPLDPCFGFHGLRVRPPNHLSPMASAPSVVLATSTAPAASRRFTTVASSSKLCFSNPPAPHVVGYPLTASRSFAPQGSPCSGPRYRPAAISASASRACASARSSVIVITKCSSGSERFSRAIYISVRLVEEILRRRTSSPSSTTEANARSSRSDGAVAIAGALLYLGWRFSVFTFAPGGSGSKTYAGGTLLGRCSLRIASYDLR